MILSNARGTYHIAFQLGREGPWLRGEAGVVQARAADDQTLARIQAAPPADPADLATKAWAEANLGPPPGLQRVIGFPFTGNVQSAAQLPAGARGLCARVRVLVPYPGARTLHVGTQTSPELFVKPTDVNLQQAGLYVVQLLTDPLLASSPVVLTIGSGGAGSGSSVLALEFAVPAP